LQATYLGAGNLHDSKFGGTERAIQITNSTGMLSSQNATAQEYCDYIVLVYSTQEFKESYNSVLPFLITVVLAFIFILLILGLYIVDLLRQKKEQIRDEKAGKSEAILASLFPSAVKDRLIKMVDDITGSDDIDQSYHSVNAKLNSYFEEKGATDDWMLSGKPIADLFPETTVRRFPLSSHMLFRQKLTFYLFLTLETRSCLATLLVRRTCTCTLKFQHFNPSQTIHD
jgi:hypothetical protein